MADLTYTQLKTEFNTRNRNSDNFVYIDAEVDSALKSAINYDPMVFRIGRDAALTTSATQFAYTPSENFETITDVKYDYYGNGSEVDFPGNWRYVDGTLWLGDNGQTILASKPLRLYGKIKLSHTDTIPTYLVDYILHCAAALAIQQLISDKSGRFLRNDTTMGELQAAYALHRQEAARLKPMLNNRTTFRV